MMRAASLDRPYSGLVAEGFKWIDTRGKPYPWRSAIGETIAIHATKKPPVVRGDIGEFQVWHESGAVWWLDAREGDVNSDRYWALVSSAIVATAHVDAVIPMLECTRRNEETEHICRSAGSGLLHHMPLSIAGETETDVSDQLPYGDFEPGRWAILLSDVEKLDNPVPCPGRQTLWTVPPATAGLVLAQVARQRAR